MCMCVCVCVCVCSRTPPRPIAGMSSYFYKYWRQIGGGGGDTRKWLDGHFEECSLNRRTDLAAAAFDRAPRGSTKVKSFLNEHPYPTNMPVRARTGRLQNRCGQHLPASVLKPPGFGIIQHVKRWGSLNLMYRSFLTNNAVFPLSFCQ